MGFTEQINEWLSVILFSPVPFAMGVLFGVIVISPFAFVFGLLLGGLFL